MKQLIYILAIFLVFTSCAGKKHVIKTHTITTRQVDTLIKIPARKLSFIPANLQKNNLPENDLTILGKSTEILTDSLTGQQMTIYYNEVMPNPNQAIKVIEKIEMHEAERLVAVKVHETIETNTKEKTVITIPWFYKAALWFTLIVVLIFILKKFLPAWLQHLK